VVPVVVLLAALVPAVLISTAGGLLVAQTFWSLALAVCRLYVEPVFIPMPSAGGAGARRSIPPPISPFAAPASGQPIEPLSTWLSTDATGDGILTLDEPGSTGAVTARRHDSTQHDSSQPAAATTRGRATITEPRPGQLLKDPG